MPVYGAPRDGSCAKRRGGNWLCLRETLAAVITKAEASETQHILSPELGALGVGDRVPESWVILMSPIVYFLS